MDKKINKQVVGNIGLYYVCIELSKLGWNVIPTSRNAKGIDILIYSQDAKRKLALQVKALSDRSAVGLGKEGFIGDFLVIVRGLDSPEVFISPVGQANKLIREQAQQYWLEVKDYEKLSRDWSLIGRGD